MAAASGIPVTAVPEAAQESLLRPGEIVDPGGEANHELHPRLDQLARSLKLFIELVHPLVGKFHSPLGTLKTLDRALLGLPAAQLHLIAALRHSVQDGFDPLEPFFYFRFHVS